MAKKAPNQTHPPVEQLRGRQVGRILIKMGALSRDKVNECLSIQKKNGGNPKIGEILVQQGLVDNDQLQRALAAQRGMEFINIKDMDIPPEVVEKVPAQMASGYKIMPIEFNSSTSPEERTTRCLVAFPGLPPFNP